MSAAEGRGVAPARVLPWVTGTVASVAIGSLDLVSGERLADVDMAYRHDGFWQSMDTLRDVRLLNGLWDSGQAPWAVWKSGESKT